MLDWLIRHSPTGAGHAIGEIIGEVQRRLDIPREVSEHSIRTTLVQDSKLAPSVRDEFLELVFTPASTGDHTPGDTDHQTDTEYATVDYARLPVLAP